MFLVSLNFIWKEKMQHPLTLMTKCVCVFVFDYALNAYVFRISFGKVESPDYSFPSCCRIYNLFTRAQQMADVRYLRAEVVSLDVTVDGIEQNDTFDASES